MITFEDTGYVADDDASEVDYDELMTQMQEGQAESNAQRKSAGYPEITLAGWADRPRYDKANHAVVWARDLAFSDSPVHSLNYDLRTLGRSGVLSINFVSSMPQLPTIKAAAQEFAAHASFDPGARYADFDPSLDRKAEYGIGGLVAAGVGVAVAKKLGFLALLLEIPQADPAGPVCRLWRVPQPDHGVVPARQGSAGRMRLDRRGALQTLCVTAGALVAPAVLASVPATDLDPRSTGLTLVREWASRPRLMSYETLRVHAVHYTEAAMAHGAAELARVLGTNGPLLDVRARYASLRVGEAANSANHVEASVIGLWSLLAGAENQQWRRSGLALAQSQRQALLPAEVGHTSDDMWMIAALQLAAWRETEDVHHLDRAALVAQCYLTRLQRPDGLVNHGSEAPVTWGRGNGWFAAGLAEVLSALPPGHALRADLLGGYRGMMAALLRHQDRDGTWHQIVDDPGAWSEASSTAMLGFAMLRGVNRGLLPPEPFRSAALRAWAGLGQWTGNDGRLAQVCTGTGQSADPAYYLARPCVIGDLHGQAALLWFAAELCVRR